MGAGAVVSHLPLARFPAPLALLGVVADLLCDPGQIVLFWGASVSPPTKCTAGVPIVLSPGQTLESPGEFLENSDAWVPTWIHYIKMSSCGAGSGGVEG